MQKFTPAFHVFKDTFFPFSPSCESMPQASATYRTSDSDLWMLRPSHTNVHDAFGSVFINASTAFTKSSSVRVGFKYGASMRPVATSKKPVRLVVPWRIYSNSIFAHCPGWGSLSGYLCSSACIPVISSVEITWPPSWLESCALRYISHISFTFRAKDSGSSAFSVEWSQYRILCGCKFTPFLKND